MPDRFSDSRGDFISDSIGKIRNSMRDSVNRFRSVSQSVSRDMRDVTGGRNINEVENLGGRVKAFLDNKPFYRITSEYENQYKKPLQLNSDGFPKEFRELYAKRIGGLSEGEMNPSPDYTSWYTKHWQGLKRQGDIDVPNERNAINNVPEKRLNPFEKGLRYLTSVPFQGDSRYMVGVSPEVMRNKDAWNIPDNNTRGFKRLIIERAKNTEGVLKPKYIEHGAPVYDTKRGMNQVGSVSRPDVEEKLQTPGFVRPRKDYLGGFVGDTFNTLSRVQQGWSSGAGLGGSLFGPPGALIGGIGGALLGTGVALGENVRGATDSAANYSGKRHIPYVSNTYDIATLAASGAGLIKGRFFNRGTRPAIQSEPTRSNQKTQGIDDDIKPIEISNANTNGTQNIPSWVAPNLNNTTGVGNRSVFDEKKYFQPQNISQSKVNQVLNNNYQSRFGRLGNYAQRSANRNYENAGRNAITNAMISGFNLYDSSSDRNIGKDVKSVVKNTGKTAENGLRYLLDLAERAQGKNRE